MDLAVCNMKKFRQPIVIIPKKITEIFYASYPINNQSDLERSPLPVSLWDGYTLNVVEEKDTFNEHQ